MANIDREIVGLDAGVSVPIRGLFNLTKAFELIGRAVIGGIFPSPSGDYLI
ncbi:MAG: hypothetical protein E6275_06405 [Veillonella sp.]|uniref:hypothetical protein n=1 Tax=Veillonella sp. TaxID=1926307 RepID=UPI002913FFAF|nr:hypothetical protein [Veillonella sp.]MDU7211751.1 hypothetical protein [Veillonella sp.]